MSVLAWQVPFSEEHWKDCTLQSARDILVTRTHSIKPTSIKNILPSKSRYKTLNFMKKILYYRYSLLFSVQVIQEQTWVLLLTIFSCPANTPCECISGYRWFMNYSTVFEYTLFSRLWLTFTKQTAVVAKTLLPLLPPSQLFAIDPLPEILASVPDTAKPAAPQLLQLIIWCLTAKQLLLLS